MKALSLMYHDVIDDGGDASSGFIGAAASAYKVAATRVAATAKRARVISILQNQ